MFNLQGSELIIILLLALVVLGPEKLPEAMRKAGQFYAEIKKMSSGFQQEFRDVIEEPMKEIRDTANMLRDSADFTKLQDGERDEKPKSAEMVAAPDSEATPVDDVPFTLEAEPGPAPTGEPAGGEAPPDGADGSDADNAGPWPDDAVSSASPPLHEPADDVDVADDAGSSEAH